MLLWCRLSFAVLVTLPDGVHGGQNIHVQAPDGRVNEIIVPDGFGPGSTFTVEFAEGATSKPTPAPTAPPMSTATPTNKHDDDGFATGFNNPNFAPAPAHATASYGADQDIDLSAYPTASDVKPVYASTPSYTASTY